MKTAIDYYNEAYHLGENGGEVTELFKLYDKAIELDPEFTEAYVARGLYYIVTQGMINHELAMKDFEKAITIEPDNEELYITIARYLGAMEYHENSIDICNRLICFKPKSSEAYFYLAWSKKDFCFHIDKLINDDFKLEEAIELEEKTLQKRYKKEALEDFNTAIELNPENGDYFYERGGLFIELGQKEKAKKDWQKSMELGNLDAEDRLSEI